MKRIVNTLKNQGLVDNPFAEVERILARRDKAIRILMKSFEGLPQEEVLRTMSGWMSIKDLEDCAKFQEEQSK